MQSNMTVHGVLNFVTTVMLLAVAVYVLLDLAGSRRSGAPPEAVLNLPERPAALTGAHVLGATGAQVGMVEFSDFECVYCARFAKNTWPELKQRYVDTGLVRFAFRHAPNPSLHPRAVRLARAAECAADQDRFWEVHDVFFEVGVGRVVLDTLPDTLEMDRDRYDQCMAKVSDDRLDEDRREGSRLNVTGTPTFLIGRIVDDAVDVSEVIPGAAPLASFVRALDRALTGA